MLHKLHTSTRIILVLLSLALGAVYFSPLWRIDLQAPQYPEGLGLWIWINRMSGDLSTINGLNHYIGMQEIHPETFAELRLMPWILGGLMFTGLLVSLLNKRLWLGLWLGLMGACGVVGFWDFWKWTYEYGHDLNPYAAIKVPGMSYQPPILGSKQLLNFTAISWPSTGGWILIGVGCMVALLLGLELLRKPPGSTHRSGHTSHVANAAVLSLCCLILLGACNPKPRELDFSQDQCAFCRMSLMDQEYGAEQVTQKGKIITFDSVECLARYQLENPEASKNTHSLWVTDAKAKKLVSAQAAYYLYSPQIPSPMGAYLTALGEQATAQELQKKYGGKILSWKEALSHIQTQNQQAKPVVYQHKPGGQ